MSENSENPITDEHTVDTAHRIQKDYLRKYKLAHTATDFFYKHSILNEDGSVNEESRRALLDFEEQGIDPLFGLYRDNEIKRIIDDLELEEALALVPQLEREVRTDPRKFSDTLRSVKTQTLLATKLERYGQKVTLLKENGTKRPKLSIEDFLNEWGVQHTSDSAKLQLLPSSKPADIHIVRSKDTFNMSLKYPYLREELALERLSEEGKIDEIYQNYFPHNTVIPATVYTDARSATLHGVGMIYDIDRVYAAYPSDIQSERVNAGAAQLSYLPQVVDWSGVRKVANSQLAVNLNKYYYYPELWVSGKPREVFVRPYDSIVMRSLASDYANDQGRAICAHMLSRAYGLPIKVLK